MTLSTATRVMHTRLTKVQSTRLGGVGGVTERDFVAQHTGIVSQVSGLDELCHADTDDVHFLGGSHCCCINVNEGEV